MTEFVNVPDCLVLKLEEYDIDRFEIDTTLYILYDKKEHNYVIRGRRKWTPKYKSCTYSFVCESTKVLADFIQYIFCSANKINETLYNYDNLPYSSKDVTFEFLQDYDHSDYELTGYDKQSFNRKNLIKKFQILRNISNYY